MLSHPKRSVTGATAGTGEPAHQEDQRLREIEQQRQAEHTDDGAAGAATGQARPRSAFGRRRPAAGSRPRRAAAARTPRPPSCDRLTASTATPYSSIRCSQYLTSTLAYRSCAWRIWLRRQQGVGLAKRAGPRCWPCAPSKTPAEGSSRYRRRMCSPPPTGRSSRGRTPGRRRAGPCRSQRRLLPKVVAERSHPPRKEAQGLIGVTPCLIASSAKTLSSRNRYSGESGQDAQLCDLRYCSGGLRPSRRSPRRRDRMRHE